uniref:Major facilitator superfamily (MFS) profile domain-containing protein n=1 Tax=Calcidiscus leptoporus TaxID=127549 RepID=A0A7S0NPP2_9EUKA
MAIELGFSHLEKGWLLAAPSVGAILTQLVGGQICSLLGARSTVLLSVIGMAACCALLPAACTHSTLLGAAVLCINGVFYGPMFPTNSVLLSRWCVPSERGWASSQGELAISLASLSAPLVITALEPRLGWRACFRAVGCMAVSFAALWRALAASTPEQCWFIRDDELELLTGSPTSPSTHTALHRRAENNGQPLAKASPLSVRRVLLHPAVLALFLVHGVYNLGTLTINSWMPTYYNEALGLAPTVAKLHLIIPHLTSLVTKLLVPYLAAALGAHGVSMLSSRQLMCAAGFIGTSCALLLLPMLLGALPAATTACFCVALSFTGLHAEGFRANYLDVTRAHVGLVSSVGNAISSLAAMAAPLIVSNLVTHYGSWQPVWLAVSASSLVATIAFAQLATVTPVEETVATPKKRE